MTDVEQKIMAAAREMSTERLVAGRRPTLGDYSRRTGAESPEDHLLVARAILALVEQGALTRASHGGHQIFFLAGTDPKVRALPA